MGNTVNWADNESTPSYYEVGHSLSRDGEYSSLGTTSNTTYAHSTGDLDSWYRLRSVYWTGTSPWSLAFQAVVDNYNDHCIIYGDLRQLDMRYALSDAEDIEAIAVQHPMLHWRWGVDVKHAVKSQIDDHGYFQLRVTKNTPIRLRIPIIALDEEYVVPSQSSVDFRDLRPLENRNEYV